MTLFHGIEAVEDKVPEPLFANFVPEILDRIELGTIRRQEAQPHVVGRFERMVGIRASGDPYTVRLEPPAD